MKILQEIWQNIIQFLAEYDSQKVVETARQMNWTEVVASPYFWLIAVPILFYLLWKRHFRTLLAVFSLGLFIYLVLNTLPPPGEAIPLNKLLTFFGGSMALVAVNLYFLFVRNG